MRTTIVLDDVLYEKLKVSIPQRKFSSFINQIIKERLADAEEKAITKKMKEGYLNTRKDRSDASKILLDQIRTIDKSRFGKKIGKLSLKKTEDLSQAIRISLDV